MKFHNKIVFSFLALVCFVQSAFTQGTETFLPSIPPAPNAAKLTEFSLTPANLYTGKQNISVPLHSFDFYGLPVNIALNYQAGGIRVSEEASWVGLGWALSVGGVVTRTVRGGDDFHAEGYIYDSYSIPQTIPYTTSVSGGQIFDMSDPFMSHLMSSSRADTEPDAYNYNFLGSSGQFVLSKKSETSNKIEAIKIDANADRIEYDETNGLFRVYNPNGFVGIFSLKEYTTSLGGTDPLGGLQGCSLGNIPIMQIMNDNRRAVTAWHLTKIISPNGRTIDFEYDVDSNGLSSYLSKTSPVYGERTTINSAFEVANEYNQSCYFTVYENVYLKRIFSTDLDLEINFISNSRADIRPLDEYLTEFGQKRGDAPISVLTPQKLSSIVVNNLNLSNSLIKTITFDHGYFNSDKLGTTDAEDYLRLKLNNVSIGEEQFQFEYLQAEDESGNLMDLPSKSSFSQDYWGYYNGQPNTRLLPVSINYVEIPRFALQPLLMSQQFYFQNEDRKANFDFGKAGLLNKVIYPTGGSTVYEYEGHDYKLEGQETTYYEGEKVHTVDGSANVNNTYTTFSYLGHELTPGGSCQEDIEITLSVACKDYWNPEITCVAPPFTSDDWAVELRDSDGTLLQSISFGMLWGENEKLVQRTYSLRLPRGDYQLIARNKFDEDGNEYYGFANVRFPATCVIGQENPMVSQVRYNEKAGGGRLKAITNYLTDGKVAQRKSFTYLDDAGGANFSSGRLVNPLFHFSFKTTTVESGGVEQVSLPFYVHQSGTSLPGGGSAQGSHIGYNRVIETFEGLNNETNGFKVHLFFNDENQFTSYGLALNETYANTNGWLKSQHTYSNRNTVVEQLNYQGEPIKENLGSVRALKLNRTAEGGMGIFNLYEIKSDFVRYKNEVVTEYRGGEELVTTRDYEFNSTFFRSAEEVTNSNGDLIRTEYKRASDYSNTSAVVQAMLDKNLLAPVIETITKVNGSVVSANATEFQRSDTDLTIRDALPELTGKEVQVLPMKQLSWNKDKGSFIESSDGKTFDNAYEQRVFYTKYDIYGNLLEYENEAGVPVTFLWAYNYNYLVAEIKNARHDIVSGLLPPSFGSLTVSSQILTTMNSLRTNNNLSSSLFTVLTYRPHFGISTRMTANGLKTYYFYDDFGRLSHIRDHQNRLLKSFDYGYFQLVSLPDYN